MRASSRWTLTPRGKVYTRAVEWSPSPLSSFCFFLLIDLSKILSVSHCFLASLSVCFVCKRNLLLLGWSWPVFGLLLGLGLGKIPLSDGRWAAATVLSLRWAPPSSSHSRLVCVCVCVCNCLLLALTGSFRIWELLQGLNATFFFCCCFICLFMCVCVCLWGVSLRY